MTRRILTTALASAAVAVAIASPGSGNAADCGPVPTPTPTPPPASTDGGKVVVVGDSYTFDMEGQTYSAGRTLTQAFAAEGWTTVASGVGGRGIGGSPTPNALNTVNSLRAQVAEADAVVIELGTNTAPDGSYFPSRAATLLGQIRGYNKTAKLYWVTPGNFVRDPAYQSKVAANVRTIVGLDGVEAIRWDQEAVPGYFQGADSYKHPRYDSSDPDTRADGYDALKTMIVRAVTGAN